MGLGRVHTCASVLIGLLRSPSEHPPLATAALADPWEPQWAPPPTIAALADPRSPSGHSPTSHSSSGKPWLRLLSPGLPHHPQTPAGLLDLPPIPLGKRLLLHGNWSLHAQEGQARWPGSVPGQLPRVWRLSLGSSPGPTENAPSPMGPHGLRRAPCEATQRAAFVPPSQSPLRTLP